jgi:uncharacterized membrane protein YeiB
MTNPTVRIDAYDHARAVAIIGMIVVNTRTIMNRHILEPWWIDSVIDLITGRGAAIFVMLAGAGMVMAYDRAPDDAKPLLRMRLVVRATLLFMIGFLLMTVWKADILHYYTAYIIGGVILLDRRARCLRKILIALVAVSIPVCTLVVYESEGGLIIETLVSTGPLAGLLDYFFLSSYYPVLPWMCFFLVGMLLGRLERNPGKRRFQILFIGSGIGFMTIELLSALLNAEPIAGRWFDIEEPGWRAFSLSEAFPAGPLFLFSAGAFGVALISFFRWVPIQMRVTARPSLLSALGRLSLTVYISHILLGHACHQWIVKPYGSASSSQTLLFAVGFILAATFFALVWTRCFMRGPLEMAMIALTNTIMKSTRTVWQGYRLLKPVANIRRGPANKAVDPFGALVHLSMDEGYPVNSSRPGPD